MCRMTHSTDNRISQQPITQNAGGGERRKVGGGWEGADKAKVNEIRIAKCYQPLYKTTQLKTKKQKI